MIFRVAKDGKGWRVVDNKGYYHSARIMDKARAEKQAETLNKKMEEIKR